MKRSALDRAIALVSPRWAVRREHARLVLDRLHGARAEYDGATQGRRSTSWRRKVRDANAELTPRSMMALRGIAHDLYRNNPHAHRGVDAIAEHMVGEGITFQLYRNGKHDKDLTRKVRQHLDTASCDAAGRHDLYGLELQAAKSIVVGGAVIMRRRWRRAADRLPLPFQIQLLEPDYIDMSKHGPLSGANGYAVNGIEFDQLGRRRGYWLYSAHPGSVRPGSIESKMIPAEDVAHVFRADRPEQEHGATWLAPVILPLMDFKEYADAQLLRQKVAACFAAFKIGDADSDDALANDNHADDDPAELESIEPGMIYDLPAGDVKFPNPPTVEGYKDVSSVTLHAVSTGLGVPYEVMTGDLSGVSFISGRLGRLTFHKAVGSWQWAMFVPQFCRAVERWTVEALELLGEDMRDVVWKWTPPRVPLLDPATEVPALRDAVRAGQMTPEDVVAESGEDFDVFVERWKANAAAFDAAGLIFDCDPRKVTAVGNAVQPTQGLNSRAGIRAMLDRNYPGRADNERVADDLYRTLLLSRAREQIERSRPGDPDNAQAAEDLALLMAAMNGD